MARPILLVYSAAVSSSDCNPDSAGKQRFGVGSVLGDDNDAFALARQLNSRNPFIRRASAEALMTYNSSGKSVLDYLERVRNDRDQNVREAVAKAIFVIQDKSK